MTTLKQEFEQHYPNLKDNPLFYDIMRYCVKEWLQQKQTEFKDGWSYNYDIINELLEELYG